MTVDELYKKLTQPADDVKQKTDNAAFLRTMREYNKQLGSIRNTTKHSEETGNSVEEPTITSRGYLNGWNDNRLLQTDPSKVIVNPEIKKQVKIDKALAKWTAEQKADAATAAKYGANGNNPYAPAVVLNDATKNKRSANIDGEDKVAKKELEKIFSKTEYRQNQYRIAYNEELAKRGLPHLSTEAVEEYNRLYSENSPSANDDAYDRQRKKNNITQLNLTYQAILSGDFSAISQSGLNKKETDFKGHTDLWNKHTKINGTIDGGGVDKYNLLSEGEKQIWNYYIGTGNFEDAKKYLNSLELSLDTRKAQLVADNLDKEGTWGDIKETAIVAGNSLYSGITDIFLGPTNMALMSNGKSDLIDQAAFAANNTSYYADTLNSAIMGEGENWFFGTAQKLASSLAYTAPGMAASSANPTLGFAVFVAQGVGRSTKEAMRDANNQSSMDDIIYGAVEGALEFAVDRALGGATSQLAGKGANPIVKKVLGVIDDLNASPWAKKAMSKITVAVGTGFSEAFEEGIQSAIDPAVRSVIYGEELDYSWGTWKNVIESAWLGFLSGGILGNFTHNSVVSQMQSEMFGEQLVESGRFDSVLNFAKDFGTDKKLYNDVKSTFENGGTPDGDAVARLYADAVNSYNEIMVEKDELLIKKMADEGNIYFIRDCVCGGDMAMAEKVMAEYSQKEVSDIAAKYESAAEGLYNEPSVILGTAQNYDEVGAAQQNTSVNNLQNGAVENVEGKVDNGIQNVYNNTAGDKAFDSEKQERLTAAVLRYKSSESYKINAKLRDNEVLSEGEQEFVDDLDEALSQLPTYEGTVYRQVSFDDFDGEAALKDFLAEHIPNEPIFYGQFTSCSKAEDGYTVEGNNKVQLIIEGENARDVAGFGNNMENEVIFTRDSVFIVKNVELDGVYPKIYLREDVDNGHFTVEEQGATMRNMQKSHSGDGDLQSVSKEDSDRDSIGSVRPQPAASAGQWNTLRAEGGQGAVLPAQPGEQVKNKTNFEADSEGSAFSMDENSDLQSNAKGITEPDISKDTRSYEEQVVENMNGRESIKVQDRQEVKELGKAIGWEVRFDDVYARDKAGNIVYITDKSGRKILDKNGKPIPKRTDAKVNKNKRIITIDYNNSEPVKTLLKHELTHFLETNIGVYRDFANKVLDSAAFRNWVWKRYKQDVTTYKKSIIDKYRGTNGFETAESSEMSSDFEMVAAFVGDNLFSDERKMISKILETMNGTQRSKFSQFVSKLFERLKLFFKGSKKQKEIAKLEREWLKAYKAAEQASKQKNTTDNSGEQYSIVSDEYGSFVKIDSKQDIFANKPTSEMQKLARKIILENFKGKVFSVGQEGKAYINRRSAEEYAYPANRRMDDGVKESKMRASVELDNILSVSEFLENEPDDGRHPDATGGWDKYITRFEVDNEMFEGQVKIKVTERGKVFYDITKIKRTARKAGQTEDNSAAASGSLSNNNIPQDGNVVNNNSMQEAEEYSLASDNEALLDMYEKGEITREEFLKGFDRKSYGLKEIADLKPEDAEITTTASRRKGEAVGDSDSKFWGSLQDSKWFDKDLKLEFAGDEFIQRYKSISNKETLLKAAAELEEGGAAYVRRWHALDAQHASLIDTAVGFILLDGYRRNGDTESAVATAEKLRQIGTAGGQQIQIFSILDRLSPEAMLEYAQRELDKAFEVMVDKRTAKWFEDNKKRFLLTEADKEFIVRRVLQASILPEGRDKVVCLAEIATRIQEKLPPDRSQGFKAWQRICMLLNPRTNIRNVLGNATITPVYIASDFFGAGIDRVIAKKTGVRTTGVFGGAGLKENAKAFKKGAWETIDDFKRHVNTRNQELNRFDLNVENMSGKAFNENREGFLAQQLNDCAKVLNALDRLTSFCLELGDRPFYEMWFVNSINNQMKLNNVTEPTPEMITTASAEALQRTWQDKNSYVNVVQSIKQGLNGLNINGYGLGDVFVKFSKTPANLTKAIVDFSPIGLVKGLSVDAVRFKDAVKTGRADSMMQKKFVDSLSKGIAGTLLYVALAALAANGLITGKGDEDKDVNAMEKYILGVPEYSIKLFGKWWSYEWMQPIGASAAVVADFMESSKENPESKWYENIIEAIRVGGEVLYNQSFMKSIQIIFTADNAIDGVIEGALSDPSVLIPQIISQAASATDKYRRVTYSHNSPIQTAINKVKVKIPGLRQTLEIERDILGREVKNPQGNVFDAFLNPANTYIATNNDVTDELYRLYKDTGDKTVMPRKVGNSITAKGTTHYFEIKEKNEYQRVMGETVNEILGEAFKNGIYQDLTDSQKAKFINDVFDYANAKAKAETVIYYDILSTIYGDALSENTYNNLSNKSKKALATEYFLDDYYYSNGKSKIETTEAMYFLKKAQKRSKEKKEGYKLEDILKIANNK